MRYTRPPFWFWRLDRWKLLAALLLALLALLLSLRGCGAPQVSLPGIVAPELNLPALAGLKAGAPIGLDGTAAPGATVRFFDGDTLLGETVAGPDGKWRFSLPALAAGAHNVTARAVDAAGKELAAGTPWRFDLPEVALPEVTLPEIVAPELNLPALAGLKTGAPFDLDGTAAPGATVRLFDDDTLLGETVAGPDGKWRFSLPALAAGAHNVTARAVDAAGKELAAGTPWRFDLPEVALPEVTLPEIVAPELNLPALAGLKAGAPIGLDGTAAPGATVRFFDGDTLLGETVAGPDGKWRFSLPALTAGAHNVTARAIDAAGKELAAGTPWRFDLPEVALPEVTLPGIVAPELNLPALAGLKAGAPFDLHGTAAPGATVRLFDDDTLLGETVAGPDGKWRFSLPALAAGAHNVTARAVDAAGKELAAGTPWRFDLPEVSPMASSTTSGTPAAPGATSAAPGTAPADYPKPYVVTLEPGATVSVPVRGYCMNYGLPFPGQAMDAVEMAPEAVRSAVAYAIGKGYVDSDPLQVQLAVWNLMDGTRVPGRSYAVADEIIRFAQAAAAPEPAGAQTLDQALADKLITASIADYRSTSPADYQYEGAGALLLRNVSDKTQTFILPYGFRFRDVAQEGVQDMAVFPLAPQG